MAIGREPTDMGNPDPEERDRELVQKNEGEMDPDDILATTYQMRNFYKQFKDGWIDHLQVMNYMQHVAAAERSPSDATVLDVCCGRSLMLPLLRYRADDIEEYIGVEIEPDNLTPLDERVTDGTSISENPHLPDTPEEYYPFDVRYEVGDAADMDTMLEFNSVDYAIYTSSIEHMHKEHGEESLDALAGVMRPGAELFLSCPNTPEDQDGYDVQYKAHVYEWKLSELREALEARGFRIVQEHGLTGKISDLKNEAMATDDRATYLMRQILDYVPTDFAKPILFAPYPELASEVLIIAEKMETSSASDADW